MGYLARNARLLAGLVLAICAAAGAAGSGSGIAYPQDAQILQHWNGSAWAVIHVHVPPGAIDLSAATAISTTDVWAVGTNSYSTDADPAFWSYPLAEHWNGSSWQAMRLPTPHRTAPYTLQSISAVAPNDIWAVGGSVAGTLLEHWNGKTWSRLPSPELRADISGVSAISRHDVWLVGDLNTYKHDVPGFRMLVEHWNGHTWRRVATPEPKGRLLQSVAASSRRDIWAVGGSLMLHWNGVRWTQVAHVPHTARSYSLSAVAAISTNDAWIVGSDGSRSLVEHWNGHRWHEVGAASFAGSSFSAIAAVNANDIWAVGTTGNPTRPFAAHWDGTSWAVVPPKNAAGNSDYVTGVAAAAADDVWLVGSTGFP